MKKRLIHFVFEKETTVFDGSNHIDKIELRYLCIQAVKPSPSKSTKLKSKVTCKNCLRKLKKGEHD